MKRFITSIVVLLFVFTQPAFPAGAKSDNISKTTGLKNKLNSGTVSALGFRNIGPAIMSGRISDIAIHPKNRNIWYITVGSGGVWKTINAGTTWKPIFDSQPSYSIGCITIDANYPDTIWVGTGENVSGRHVGFGDGIYKSLNGGKTWQNMGLKDSEHISKIIVAPGDSNVVYVACEGPLWSPGGERGLYKTNDGGKSWKLSLEISRDTGVADVIQDGDNPDILYASAYQRRRTVASFLAGGPESGIYKSMDAGKNWRKLKVGLPSGDMGRIGLAISPFKTNVIYATIEAEPKSKGFYRSEDGGESWQKRNSYCSGGTGAHYYQEIYADPHKFDRVYQMDFLMRLTEDGGKTFLFQSEEYKHSDNHAMAFDPLDADFMLVGSDGGLYETHDRGKTWRFFTNLPLTQFYKCAVDNALPVYNVHGGTQDNGSQMGPSRTLNVHGIRNLDWISTLGADGHGCAIDPENPDIIYAESQNGFLQRYDKKNGETVSIRPRAEPDQPADRWNWDTPIIISPHSNTRLYVASQRLYRSDDRGDSWKVVSPDLSRNLPRFDQKIMGRKRSFNSLWHLLAMSKFSNITRVSESPLKEGLIYAGTDDGLIQVTENGGQSWRKTAKIPGVPDYFFVNDIAASRHDADTVYAALDNHKTGDLKPYLVKSSDRGKTWSSITGDLPAKHIVWAIAQDHKKKDLIFIGTEFGIFFSIQGGNRWVKLTSGLPTISFRDLEIQERENDLIGASFGRGFYVLDNYSPLRQIDTNMLKKEAMLFPVKKAQIFIPANQMGMDGKAYRGHSFYSAPNPPFGAVFTYYLKESLKTGKQLRRAKEKKLEKQNKNVLFPGWDVLRQEDIEEKPELLLTVKDSDGQIVRRLTAPAVSGIRRLAWDLRYPTIAPTSLKPRVKRNPYMRLPVGPLVLPGTYSVTLSKRVNGEITELTAPQSFKVESLGIATLPAKDKAALLAFQEKAGELQRVTIGAVRILKTAYNRVDHIKKALYTDIPNADKKLGVEARKIERQLEKFDIVLLGDYIKYDNSESVHPGLAYSISRQLNSTAAITATNKRNYEIALVSLTDLLDNMRRVIDGDLRNLEDKIEAAGSPWTPGRSVPRLKIK
ncbi:MAG: glycosyl hydrolase [bacterium]|nr:glycosyl hydrolase [bacterium]